MVRLRIAGIHGAAITRHLYQGDGRESVAIALCGRLTRPGDDVLIVHEVHPVPNDLCFERRADRIRWSTEQLPPLLERADEKGLSILKIHSHPGGYADFSTLDDESDRELFESIAGWIGHDGPHASAILLPDGTIFGRAIWPGGAIEPLHSIFVAGDDVRLYFGTASASQTAACGSVASHAQAFGEGTTGLLAGLAIAVIGASGTGGPTIEQLARLGIGRLVLVDPDRVELRNLNRIPNATGEDALQSAPKVDVQRRAIEAMGLGTDVTTYQAALLDREVLQAVASCDIVFGCMDSTDGRLVLNRLATYYGLPYFDIGVKIIADGLGGVEQVAGTVHYLQPGGASLMSRNVFSLEEAQAEALRRTDPAEYERRRGQHYVVGVEVDRPAVISVNYLFSSLAVNELLARLHPYRLDPSSEFAVVRVSLSHDIHERETDGSRDEYLAHFVGCGDQVPMLGLPWLDGEGAR